MNAKTTGADAARANLPALLELAHHGTATVITKRGRAYAALVPIKQLHGPRTRTPIASLKGTGAGLWGADSRAAIADLRDEWA